MGEFDPTRPAAPSRSVLLSTFLVLLSVAGIAVLQYLPDRALVYWLAMVPIFAVVATVRSHERAGAAGMSAKQLIGRQTMHWSGLLLAILLVFLMRDSAGIDGEAAGLMALLALALTTFLAGVHFDWHFMVLGIVLGLTVVGGLLAESFFWILLVPAVIAIGVLIGVRRPHVRS